MMMAADCLTRLPTTAAVLVFSTLSTLLTFSTLAAGHVLPRETKTVQLVALNVVEWPLVAPPAPTSPATMQRRQLNTICGYLGGDPTLPATCLAGSHCVVDVDYGAVGCCPDTGPCTAGIFTGCVDVNSPPQTVLDPYVYTCGGNQVCYMNSFEGGYFQYGCGSASHMATTVATTALSRLPLDFSRVSVALTETPTALSEPTTIGTPSPTTGPSTSATTTAATTSGITQSTGASDSSNTGTTSSGAAISTADPSAPTSTDSSNSTGPVVGGVIGGLAALAVLGALAFWLWRRKNKAALPKQYINPSVEKYEEFMAHPYTQNASTVLVNASSDAEAPQPDDTNRDGPDSNAAALAVPTDNSRTRPSDEIPLTTQGHRAQGGGITATTEIEVEAYPVLRRAGGGGGYLWSQNRSEPRTRSRAKE